MNAKSVKAVSVSDLDKKREEVEKKHPAMPEEKMSYKTILGCGNDIETAMDNWSLDGQRFDIHSTEGWSVFFRYNDVYEMKDLDEEPVEMAFKVQPAETHDEMVWLWDMHCLSGSLEEFIDRYSEWYVKLQEYKKNKGGSHAVANS